MKCTDEMFLSHVANHKMIIMHDNPHCRHLRFKAPEHSNMCFDIITWPWHLCFTGDMGTYVFSRTADMFDFFRSGERINPSYWGEKLLAIDPNTGFKKYSEERFKETVREDFESWELDTTSASAVWEEIEEDVLSPADSEESAYRVALDFEASTGETFGDFWEHDLREHTFHYIWCLYAIRWGISQYDGRGQ